MGILIKISLWYTILLTHPSLHVTAQLLCNKNVLGIASTLMVSVWENIDERMYAFVVSLPSFLNTCSESSCSESYGITMVFMATPD